MAGIDKLRTNSYGDYNDFRIWCIKNKPKLLNSFYEPFLSYIEWDSLQKETYRICSKNKKDTEVKEISLIITHFSSNEDKYLYWHCPLDFIREYLETQCGYKKANWFVKLFWKY
jgi:hypothetical protein